MSFTNDFSFGVGNPSIDVVKQKAFPAVILTGTEVSGLTSEVVEIAGQTWITTNAVYVQSDGGFLQVNPLVASQAIVVNPSGPVQNATAPAGSPTPIVWTLRPLGGGGGGTIASVTGTAPIAVSSGSGPSPNVTLAVPLASGFGGTGVTAPTLVGGSGIVIGGTPFNWTVTNSAPGTSAFVINVKLPPYNAVGNGIADDTTALQAAANAVPASGAQLYFPAGTYLISTSILLNSNTTVDTDGAQLTNLVASGTFVGQPVKSSAPSQSAVLIGNSQMGTASTSPVQKNIFVKNLSINGNGFNPSGSNPGACIFFRQVYNVGVFDCEVVNSNANGIAILGWDSPTNWPGPNIMFQCRNNHVNLNYNPNGAAPTGGTFPLTFRGASNGLIDGNTTGDLNVTHTNDSGDFDGCANVVCSNNKYFNGGDGIDFLASPGAVIVGNLISGAGGYGISGFSSSGKNSTDPDGSSYAVISGNLILNHGGFGGTNPGKTGIRFASPQWPAETPVDFSITGNTVQFFGAGAYGPSGIHIEGSNGTISGNTIDLNGAALTGITLDGGPAGQAGGPGIANISVSGNTVLSPVTGGVPVVGTKGIQYLSSVGNVTDCTIVGNTIIGVALPIAPPGPGQVGCIHRVNTGINPYGFFTGAPALVTATNIANPYPYDVMVFINCQAASTVTAVTMAGPAYPGNPAPAFMSTGQNCVANNSITVILPAHASINVTFTGTVGWKWYGL